MRFVCWLWAGSGFWKRTVRYDGQHVAVLAAMLRRHGGHDLTCVHDGAFDLPAGVDQVLMPSAVRDLPDYLPKLWAWSPEFHGIIGERFASIDLDCVVLGDPSPLLKGCEQVRLWDRANLEPYNTSLFVLQPGFGCSVWESYTPARAADSRARAAYWTGDQSWVAHVLGPDMPTFGERDGILQYRPRLHRQSVPESTRVAFFCGPFCPRSESEHSAWVRQHWH